MANFMIAYYGGDQPKSKEEGHLPAGRRVQLVARLKNLSSSTYIRDPQIVK